MRKKPPIEVGRFVDGSPEWHAARATGLGGSDLAAIVGLSPWTSHFQLWHAKRGNLPPVEQNDAMLWGHLLEPVIRQEWIDSHLEPGQTLTTGVTYRHPEHEWLIVNPDGLVWNEDGTLAYVLEIKTSAEGHGFGPSDTDLVPIWYRVQVMAYMEVMGAERAIIRALVSGNNPRTYTIEFDQGDADYLLDAGDRFWQSLKDGIEPDLDSTSSTYETVRALYPGIDNETVEISADLAADLVTATNRRKHWEAEERYARSRIGQAMGHARWAECDGKRIATRVPPVNKSGFPYVRATASKPIIQTFIRPTEGEGAAA